jgi:predicted CoA-binding protein
VDEFWQQKRIAVVGVSRDEEDFTRKVFRELRRRGYDVVPVNPNATELEGARCFASVRDITPRVDGALVMATPAITDQVVRDCAAASVKRVWMHRGEGIGAVSDKAVAFCEQNGIGVVAGLCPYMFLPNTPFFHRVHGFFKKMSRDYPR